MAQQERVSNPREQATPNMELPERPAGDGKRRFDGFTDTAIQEGRGVAQDSDKIRELQKRVRSFETKSPREVMLEKLEEELAAREAELSEDGEKLGMAVEELDEIWDSSWLSLRNWADKMFPTVNFDDNYKGKDLRQYLKDKESTCENLRKKIEVLSGEINELKTENE